MKTLKTTLRSEAGFFVHVAIATVLAVLLKSHLLAVLGWGAEMIYLGIRRRRLFWTAFFVSVAVGFSFLVREMKANPLPQSSYRGRIVETGKDAAILRQEGIRILVRIPKGVVLIPGDEVEMEGNLSLPSGARIPHTFDYGAYLASEGIVATLFAEEIRVIGHRFHLNQLQTGILHYLSSAFPGEEGGFLIYVLLGNNDFVPPDTQEAVQKLGISHLFAISGMNVAMLVAFLERVLKTLYLQRGLRESIILGILGGYVVATGFQVSITRSVLMVLCVYLRERAKLPFSRLDLLSLVLVGFLVANPFSIHALGFQLSFLMAFALLIGKDILTGEGEIRGMLKIAVYAHIVALPILLDANHSFSLLSIPANLFFVLFVERILFPLTFLTAFVPPFFPIFQGVTDLFRSGVVTLASFDLSIGFTLVSDLGKAGYFLLVGGLFLRVETHRPIKGYVGALGFLFLMEWSAAMFPGVTFVRVLDVGQGDAIHIRSGGFHVLIDTGNSDDYNGLIEYFRGENIRSLDAVILTHDHEDHTGEITDLSQTVTIRRLIVGDHWPSLRGLPHEIVRTGDEIQIGSLRFLVLASNPQAKDENDRSLVLAVRIGCHDWVLTGDAGTEVETTILNDRNVEGGVVKVGHHGSYTASSWAWVRALHPVVAVVSVDENNSYGLPDSGVLNRYETVGAKVLRTDRCETITFWYPPGGNKSWVFQGKPSGFLDNEIGRFVGFF